MVKSKLIPSWVLLFVLFCATLACKKAGGDSTPYVSEKHRFQISLPEGAKEPSVVPSETLGEDDVTYSTTNGEGIYRVRVFKWSLKREAGTPVRDWGVGAGVEIPQDDVTTEISVHGVPAMETTGWTWSANQPGAEKLFVRTVALQKDETVYEISMRTNAEATLKSANAKAFFDSFKVN